MIYLGKTHFGFGYLYVRMRISEGFSFKLCQIGALFSLNIANMVDLSYLVYDGLILNFSALLPLFLMQSCLRLFSVQWIRLP